MDIQNQVCTLEQAERLYHLNVVQKATFSHFTFKSNTYLLGMKMPGEQKREHFVAPSEDPRRHNETFTVFSAFTLSELYAAIDWNHCSISPPYKKSRDWWIMTNGDDEDFHHANPVIASADALIWLIEKGIVKIADVNNRLNPYSIKKAV